MDHVCVIIVLNPTILDEEWGHDKILLEHDLRLKVCQ